MKDEIRVAAGRKSRRKGAGNERTVAKLFQKWWGSGSWARTPASGGWATRDTRESFRTCGDIITDVVEFPFVLELKQQEGWTLDQLVTCEKPIMLEWWKQAVEETPDGKLPMLVAGRNHNARVVMFHGDDVYNYIYMLDKNAPCPWTNLPFYDFWLNHSRLKIMSLDNFFTINPDVFGRKQIVGP